MDGWDSYEIAKEDKEKGLIAKIFPTGDGHTGIIVKYTSKRLTMEHIRELAENREEHMKKMMGGGKDGKDAKMKMTRLADQQGFKCYLAKLKTPFFMDDRTFINVSYEMTKEDGTFIQCESTKGNESLLVEYAS